jgi:uncharacterized protein (DUF1697 family)
VTTFVALLRGVNVGGNTKLPMADLRGLMTEMGFGYVQTYIQSGNVVFTAGEVECEPVRLRLESAIAERFGFSALIIVLTAAQFLNAAHSNPFEDITQDPAKLHVGFMTAPPEVSALENLRTKPQGTDQWTVVGTIFYLHAPDGMGKSVLAPFIERTLEVLGTFRNWRTVLALSDMAK